MLCIGRSGTGKVKQKSFVIYVDNLSSPEAFCSGDPVQDSFLSLLQGVLVAKVRRIHIGGGRVDDRASLCDSDSESSPH